MVVLGVSVHGEQLVADAERGLSPCFDLVSFREGEAELAEPSERAWRHRASI
jgi:hypothetical protein